MAVSLAPGRKVSLDPAVIGDNLEHCPATEGFDSLRGLDHR